MSLGLFLKKLGLSILRLLTIISLKFLRLAQLIIFAAFIFCIIQGGFFTGIFLVILLFWSESRLYQKYKNAFVGKTNLPQTPISKKLVTKNFKVKLETLIREFRREIPLAALEKLIHIKKNILILLPHLDKMQEGDYNLHIVKKTVTDYLPQTLMSYSELPSYFSENHKMNNGKTAQDILMEQLNILDEQIQKIVIEVNSKNADELIIQGEFLKSKFFKHKL